MYDPINFAEKLKSYKEKTPFSFTDLENRSGIPSQTLKNWTGERAPKRPPEQGRLLRLAAALDLNNEDTTELLEFAGYSDPSLEELGQLIDDETDKDVQRVLTKWVRETLQQPKLTVPLSPQPLPPVIFHSEEVTAQHIVGREEELQLLGDITYNTLPYIVNIYGPGGIGKTIVCHKFKEWCIDNKIPYAMVTGDDPTASTIDKILYRLRVGLEHNAERDGLSQAFNDFDRKFNDYLVVKKVIDKGGGIDKMFDLAGNLLDQALLKTLLDTVEGVYKGVQSYFAHRYTLERYIDGVDRWLTNSFVEGVDNIVGDGRTKVVLLIDTYEMMEEWDDWMCDTFVKALPDGVKIFMFGRDRLNRNNFDWSQYEKSDLHYHELQELSEVEAKAYLRYHDLQEDASLDRVYRFTGGYPLCLVLAVELAREIGWNGVRDFEAAAPKDRVASQLLDRILRQEKVKEVQEFLEKGVVTEWFDPGAVSYILEVSPERGREIYDKIGKFSFVQLHPNGLKFHDKVRQLLEERLMFMDGGKTFLRLAERWSGYLEARAGIKFG